jgi:hypothetical protein
MKSDRITKVLLGIVSILVLLNLLNSVLSSKPALAVSGGEEKGREGIRSPHGQLNQSEHWFIAVITFLTRLQGKSWQVKQKRRVLKNKSKTDLER